MKFIDSPRSFAIPGLFLGLFPVFSMAQSKALPDTPPPAKVTANEIAVPPSYQIGPGDVLQIDVWKEPEISVPALVVPADGVIALPLVKEIQVNGLTPAELRQRLATKLSTLIRDPDVTVMIKEIHSPKVFIVGAVRKEGPLLLNAPTSVLQALAEAGGLTDYAKKSKIYVLRLDNGKQTRIPVDYPAVLRGERVQDNVMLKPGDTIVVP